MQELQDTILRHALQTVTPTAVPGLVLYRSDSVRSATVPVVYTPMLCVMAQGHKQLSMGTRTFRYTPANYLVTSVDLPVRGTMFRAAPGRPYLSLSLALDPVLLGEMLASMNTPLREVPTCGMALGRLDESLLDCFVRLLRLLDHREDIPYVAPLITREIYYRILRGDQGPMLRQACGEYGRIAKIAQAIRSIRNNFHEPFSAEQLARTVHMSAASFNRHFRAVTAMSPLQYQKQLRLLEARRLLMTGDNDATTTAFQVGYASASQFSREYARTFGQPPLTDALRLRAGAEQGEALLAV